LLRSALIEPFPLIVAVIKKHKSELNNDPFLPLLNSKINQICSLERSVQRSGRD